MARQTQPYLSVKEFAALYAVTERTVRNWVRDEAVTVKRIGRGPRATVRILQDEPPDPSDMRKI